MISNAGAAKGTYGPANYPLTFVNYPSKPQPAHSPVENAWYSKKFGYKGVQYEIRLYLYNTFFIETIYKLIGIGFSSGYQDQVCTPRY